MWVALLLFVVASVAQTTTEATTETTTPILTTTETTVPPTSIVPPTTTTVPQTTVPPTTTTVPPTTEATTMTTTTSVPITTTVPVATTSTVTTTAATGAPVSTTASQVNATTTVPSAAGNFCPGSLLGSSGGCSCVSGVCSVTVPFVLQETLVVPAFAQFVFARGLALNAGSKLLVVIGDSVAVPPPIVVVGQVNISGTLAVRTASATASPTRLVPANVVVMRFGASRGVFQAIQVESVDGCTQLSAVPTMSSSFMLLQITATQVCAPLSSAAIIAICVLSVAGTLAIAMIIGFVVYCRRKKARR